MRKTITLMMLFMVSMFGPSTIANAAAVGGPLAFMGIDAEDGGVGSHGPLSAYTGVTSDILANVLNGGDGILVIGGGKSGGDNVTSWWTALAASVGEPVTFANGAAIGSVGFDGYAMIGVASSVYQTGDGGLTQSENDLFAPRESDLVAFVNSGGGLLGLSQDGLFPRYPYLNSLGAFTIQTGRGDADVSATSEGAALGLTDFSLDVCCWHDGYESYPSFLLPLLVYSDSTAAAIGGRNVVIARPCTDAEMPSVAVARPAPGRVYLDDADIGSAPTAEPLVKGIGITIEGTASASADRLVIKLDGVSLGTLTSPPFTTLQATPALGQHTLSVTAHDDEEMCFKTITSTFTVVCVGVGVTISRPASGRAYLDDADVGASGSADPLLLGGPLTIEATSGDPVHTEDVTLAMDATSLGADASSPYTASIDTDPLAPGVHLVRATLRERTNGCASTTVVAVRRTDPKVKAVAEGLFINANIPAEPQVHAGGSSVSGEGGSSFIRAVDRHAPPVDHVHAITDETSGSIAPFASRASSLVTDLSINGGMITADALHAKASATFDPAALTGDAVDDGSTIANLRIAGTPIAHAAPNTTVTLPGGMGRVVVQETITATEGFTREITVNMLHVWLTTPSFKGEIIIGSAHAGVSLPGGPFTGPATDLIHRADDAGSGRDAGETVSGAVPLTDGTYGAGMLTADDGSDFYTFSAGQGDRISIEMAPSIREQVFVGAGPAPTIVGPTQPDFNLFLRDPNGAIRDTSVGLLSGSIPERVELNADIPYAPAGSRATWSVEVRRASIADGFYTLNLHIAPAPLLDQNDGNLPGDASASCTSPRALPMNGTENDVRASTGVIRDDDTGDTYSVDAQIGQTLAITMKPDELLDGANFDLFLYAPSTPGGAADCSAPAASSTLGAEPLPKAMPEVVAALPVRITGTYVFEVRRINAVANYSFEVSLVNDMPTLQDNDAGTGQDAGDSCATPTQLESGLYQGRVGDVPADDRVDWYAVALGAGQDLSVVMKSADPNNLTLRLYRPDCTSQAPDAVTITGMPLSAPETAHIRDAAAGVWRLEVSRGPGFSDGGNYALAIAVTP